jgi:hypothetical protein
VAVDAAAHHIAIVVRPAFITLLGRAHEMIE